MKTLRHRSRAVTRANPRLRSPPLLLLLLPPEICEPHKFDLPHSIPRTSGGAINRQRSQGERERQEPEVEVFTGHSWQKKKRRRKSLSLRSAGARSLPPLLAPPQTRATALFFSLLQKRAIFANLIIDKWTKSKKRQGVPITQAGRSIFFTLFSANLLPARPTTVKGKEE